MSILSTTGQNGSLKSRSNLWHEGTLPTGNWQLPSTSTKIKSLPLQLLTFNITERLGWRSGIRHSVLWKNWQNRPSESWTSSGKDFESQFLHPLIHRETLTLLKMISALANKKNIESQNRATMVQTSTEIMRWHNGCNFRLVFALLTSWVFWNVSGLDATGHYQTVSAGS